MSENTSGTSGTFGLTAWSELKFYNPDQDSGSKFGKDLWMKFDSGKDNVIRVLTQPAAYRHHEIKEKDDKSYGMKINCAGPDCPICEYKDADGKPKFPARRRFYLGIIDRKSNSFKLLDASSMIVKRILKYTQMASYGNPTKYDLIVTIDKSDPSNYYSVVADIPKPMSESDLEIKNSVDINKLLTEKTSPRPRDWVEKQFAIALEKMGGKVQTVANGGQIKKTSPAPEATDDDFQFQDADS